MLGFVSANIKICFQGVHVFKCSGCRKNSANPRALRKLIILILAFFLLIQCNGKEDNRPLKPKFSSIQQKVINQHCTRPECHSGPVPESQLNLEEGQAYRNLVNRPSVGIAEYLLVKPHHPEESYLIFKLEGTRIVGEPMPMGEKPLPDSVIAVIRQWIDNGALDN